MITARIVTIFLLPIFGAAYAQRLDSITGRVVSDGGIGLAGVNVFLTPVGDSRSGSPRRTTTDEEGYFTFTGLTGKSYSVNVSSTKGYFQQPVSEAARRGPYSPGENVTLTMIKGAVITGRVLSPEGDPVIAVPVSAYMVRDRNGRVVRASSFSGRQRFTDDLGVYRIYGLPPGSYIVAANPAQGSYLSPYRGEMTVYHPASTRDTAAEVTVESGNEATGIDIRYRGDLGYKITGTITGLVDSGSNYGTSILLYYSAGMVPAATTGVSPGNAGFEFNGLTDGEYVLTARRNAPDEDGFFSPPQHIAIKGADVTGINLKLFPLSTIAGKVIIENKQANSENNCTGSLDNAGLTIRRDDVDKNEPPSPFGPFGSFATITDSGLFTVRNLEPGHHRVEMRLHANLYIKAITLPAPRVTRRAAGTVDLSRSGLLLRSGDRVKDLIVILLEGAAMLRGKIIAEDGSSLPPRMRVHLVPAESVAANDLLRYFEVQTGLEHTFTISNIAPGKYWILSRPVADETINLPSKPVAWDTNERAKLRKEAEARLTEIELKPCQRVSDQNLKY